jgi:hypothetical protein
MNKWNQMALASVLLAMAISFPLAAQAAEASCPAGQMLLTPGAQAQAAKGQGKDGMPRVRITRPRCVPVMPRKPRNDDDGCATARSAAPNPPPHQSEAAFGEVPVAALVPPSLPYPDQVPAGSPTGGPSRKTGCGVRPAS